MQEKLSKAYRYGQELLIGFMAAVKKKLCWNCEGRVSFQEEHCPYCGVYIDGTLHGQNHVVDDEEDKEDAMQPGENQLHKPPYIPEGMKSQETSISSTAPQTKAKLFSLPAMTMGSVKNDLLPLALLLSGSVFFLFGLALLVFGENGVFHLEWDASWWFIYLLIALPALVFGWRFLNNTQETAQDI